MAGRANKPEPSSPNLRLSFLKHEKEYRNGKGTKRVNQRGEQQHRSLHAPQNINQGGDEIPHQESRH